jgi:hypothetical protein
MFEPLLAIEKDDLPRYGMALQEWQGIEARNIADMKAYTAHCANPMNALSDAPAVTTLPPKPVPLRFRTQDATSQKLAYLCAERPSGIACIMDEGAGWLKRVTDKNSGDNRSTWTESYESNPHYFDRVGAGSLYIENLAVPIYTNVQPDVIASFMRTASDDGLIQRFLPGIIPDSNASRVGVGRPDFLSYKHQWEQCLRRIHSATQGGKQYRLCEQGESLLYDFEHYLENLKREERLIQSAPALQSSIGKLLGQLGRMIFIYHLIESPDDQIVSLMTVSNAIDLFKTYMIPSLRAFYAIGDKTESFEKWLAEYLLVGNEEVISVSEVIRGGRRLFESLGLSGYRAIDLVE